MREELKAYIICCIISLIEDVAIMTMALQLSFHTSNYKWMWLIALFLTTTYQSRIILPQDK